MGRNGEGICSIGDFLVIREVICGNGEGICYIGEGIWWVYLDYSVSSGPF